MLPIKLDGKHECFPPNCLIYNLFRKITPKKTP